MKPLPFFIILSMIVGFIAGFFCTTHKPGSKPQLAQFTNGQILLPDYAHSDTLIVINEDGLNEQIKGAETDGEISDVLHSNCKSIAPRRKLLDQITDERGLTSVIYVERGDTVALDYIGKHEFDSHFKK